MLLTCTWLSLSLLCLPPIEFIPDLQTILDDKESCEALTNLIKPLSVYHQPFFQVLPLQEHTHKENPLNFPSLSSLNYYSFTIIYISNLVTKLTPLIRSYSLLKYFLLLLLKI